MQISDDLAKVGLLGKGDAWRRGRRCDGIFEWVTDNSIRKLRINIKAESEYEEKPASTEL